jgi:spore coat polysaccharide biosynthesis protein SpsF
LAALVKMTTPVTARFIIGPGFRDRDALAREVTARGFEAVRGASDLREEFAAADCAVIAFGVTAYEMAALGVPALYLALTEDHARAASAFADAGMGVLVPPDASAIASALEQLLADKARRATMSTRAQMLIDGKGAERIADELAALCEA